MTLTGAKRWISMIQALPHPGVRNYSDIECVHVFRLSFRQAEQKRKAAVMSPSLNHTAATQLAMAVLIVMLGTASGFADPSKRKPTVVVHPRYYYVPVSPYAPYYYSRWNPYSIYSIYDHLSGGRQLCHLPSEPCDNQHRVQN
jgi:hypothetical protein